MSSAPRPLRLTRSVALGLGLGLALGLCCFVAAAASAAQETDDGKRLLLYPDIHRDFVVFVHAGDLWRASVEGGEARRLTSHDGLELFPKISPDGEWIAFGAEYSGSRQVWLMPAEGGAPRQLTFYTDVGPMPPRGGWDQWVLDWTPDGKILVRMNRTPWGVRMGRYFLVDPAGGLERPLPIPHGGTASFSPDGTQLVYTPIDREFRTWKRSVGGRAQDLWLYDLDAERSTRLTDFRGTDNFPMWHEDQIYFTSDRDYTLEIFQMPSSGGAARQVTRSDTWDVLWPSLGPDSIVFVRGGELRRLDLATERETTLDVRIHDDRAWALPRFEDVSDNLDSSNPSPSGQRVVVSARGDLFSVPVEYGPTRQLTSSSSARERDPSYSPDGRWLAYVSDESGESEIYLRPADSMPSGRGEVEARRLTTGASTWIYAPRWSPDSTLLAFADRDRRLQVVDVATGTVTQVDKGFRGDLRTFEFSPDSRWLAYEQVREDSRLFDIVLYSIDRDERIYLGDGLAPNYSPSWSHDGQHLFFVSDRDYQLRFSSFEFDYVYDDSSRVYVVALHDDTEPLFPPRSDDEVPPGDDDGDEGDDDAKERSKRTGSKSKPGTKSDESSEPDEADDPPVTRVDAEGLDSRVVALPGLSNGVYRSLVAVEGGLLYLAGSEWPPRLERFDLESRETSTVASAASGFQPSADGSMVLVNGPDGLEMIEPEEDGERHAIDLGGLRAKIDPREEWRQMFDESWRIARDYFYDPNMHGMDWDAIGARYRALLPRIAHRAELDFLLGEMIGELGAGHTYVNPGETEAPERVEGGKLGAELEADESGVYRFARIFEGENWITDLRSPLTEAGVDVEEGDFLLAIDGVPIGTDDNPYRLLEGKASQAVTLTVNDRPSTDGARDVVVVPIATETALRYTDWVRSRMRIVDELSGGRVGYIHLPNTAFAGNDMLQKLFYSQSNKDALIVDDRYNGGGFIPDQMIAYLEREPLAWWAMRDIDSMRTPGFAHDGPKIMLVNGYSSSGGDALPYFFRKKGLGELVGSRTWGGLIGLNGNPSLMDGGGVLMCTFRIYDDNGEWVVENEGVVPDVEVFDVAEEIAAGRDPSIEVAVERLLAQLEANPPKRPTRPEAPDLSRDAGPVGGDR